jgi:uncharacterized protein
VPLLVDGECSISKHRPRTCRTYDCRIFAATGVAEGDKPLIARQVRRWRFGFPAETDHVERDALRAATKVVEEYADLLPEDRRPVDATEHVVLAVRLRGCVLQRDDLDRGLPG